MHSLAQWQQLFSFLLCLLPPRHANPSSPLRQRVHRLYEREHHQTNSGPLPEQRGDASEDHSEVRSSRGSATLGPVATKDVLCSVWMNIYTVCIYFNHISKDQLSFHQNVLIDFHFKSMWGLAVMVASPLLRLPPWPQDKGDGRC